MKVPIIDTNLKNVTLSINIHTNLSYKLIIMVWISLFYLYEYVRAYQTYLIASPHSGQNFGCSEESFGFHPHFTQRVSMESTGLLAPHSVQNFPLFKAPHIHFQINVLGFSAPHTEQNYLCMFHRSCISILPKNFVTNGQYPSRKAPEYSRCRFAMQNPYP